MHDKCDIPSGHPPTSTFPGTHATPPTPYRVSVSVSVSVTATVIASVIASFTVSDRDFLERGATLCHMDMVAALCRMVLSV